MDSKRSKWSGQLAFVLAAAASAVGLGNLWRFPYLAGKYGGGVFIAAYLGLSLTLGFVLLVTEIALGRRSRQSQLTLFDRLGYSRWRFLGVLATIVPLIILPYYNVIGGWVFKYLAEYSRFAFCGGGFSDSKAFFDTFVSAPWEPFVYMAVFTLAAVAVVLLGVKNGIERSNLVMMPVLFLIAFGIAIYIAFLPGAAAGIKHYLVPDFSGCDNFGKVILGAMGQMFYSLSLAMGIMITYGSYMRRENSITSASVRIVAADTIVAVLSGFIIIPVVVMFSASSGDGRVSIDAGPGLMFETLPRIFSSLGSAGPWMGLVFFVLVAFAALTSAISMMETCVASVSDFFRIKRPASTLLVALWSILFGSVSAFGYGRWAGFRPFGMPALDFFDFSANSVLMPIVAALTCVFVGWVLRPGVIVEECEAGGNLMKGKMFYSAMVKYLAPALVIAIFVSEICRVLGIGGWSI